MMKTKAKIHFLSIFLIALFAIGLGSCKKKNAMSTSNLAFSVDTVVFDTVFTTIGSATQSFKIYNHSDKPLKISSIQLMGGAKSPYKINVDGVSGVNFLDIEIGANDSLFAFVKVNIDKTNQTYPVVIEDSIQFRTNGKNQYIQLAAWGQDMYYHYSDFTSGLFDLNEGVWPNDKPHVIVGAAVVDSAKSLTIQQDTKIYLHKDASIFVYKGAIQINGTKGHEVEFKGDRLEKDYVDISGQYYAGVYFYQAQSSSINYTNIYNATAGIHLSGEDATNTDYTLKIANSKLINNASYGIWCFSGAKVKAENCLLANSGIYGLFILGGGDFNLNHCDLVGFQNQSDKSAALAIKNYYYDPKQQTTLVGYVHEGVVKNSVLYGVNQEQILFDTINVSPAIPNLVNYNFSYSLFKSTLVKSSQGLELFLNEDPLFKDVYKLDFHFLNNSKLSDSGTPTSLTLDLEENIRSNVSPDIGIYEE